MILLCIIGTTICRNTGSRGHAKKLTSCKHDDIFHGMKRTQIQLEEEVFDALHERAYATHTSVAAQIRAALRSYAAVPEIYSCKKKNFSFIGAGSSRGKRAGKISEKHDEELSRVFL